MWTMSTGILNNDDQSNTLGDGVDAFHDNNMLPDEDDNFLHRNETYNVQNFHVAPDEQMNVDATLQTTDTSLHLPGNINNCINNTKLFIYIQYLNI